MSTRSIIARPTESTGGFEGRYHHNDGYPAGVGKTLWSLIHGKFAGDVHSLVKILIDDHTGWSTINQNWDNPIGFIERFAQLPGESYNDMWKREAETTGPRCYCHGDRNEPGWMVTDQNPGDLQEYLYIIDPTNETLAIVDTHGDLYSEMEKRTFSFSDNEPDWDNLFTH